MPHFCHVAVPEPLHQGINAVFVHSSQSATVLRMVCAMGACTATASVSAPRAGLGSAVKPDWVRGHSLGPTCSFLGLTATWLLSRSWVVQEAVQKYLQKGVLSCEAHPKICHMLLSFTRVGVVRKGQRRKALVDHEQVPELRGAPSRARG